MTLSLKQRFLNLFALLKEDKLTKDNFDECVELEMAIRSAAIFSSNEDASDLQSTYIKYLMGDFILAIVLECFQNHRLNHLKFAENYYMKYLNNCIKYELISKEGIEYTELMRYFIEDKDSDDVKEERFENWLKNVQRDLKIDRMKRILRLKNTQSQRDVTSGPDDGADEEIEEGESDNQFWLNWINCSVLMTLDRLGLLLREIELLELGQNEAEIKKPEISNVLNDKITTKVEKPFKLVKDRKQIAADAFKYGHNLPTMTIDEYLDLEKKRGNIISGGGAASVVKKEIDEDDEAAMEIELKKAREFDEFKDMYSRGSGNTYNRS